MSSYEGKAEHERRPAWLVTAEKLEGKSAWRTSGFLRNSEGMPYVSGAFGLSRAGNEQKLEQNQEMTYRNVLLVRFW